MRKYIVIFFIFFIYLFLNVSVNVAEAGEPIVEVTVEEGDFLIKICEQYLDEPRRWPEVARFNKLKNPDLIYPRQVIAIPAKLLKGTPIDGVVSFLRGTVEHLPEGTDEWKPLQLNDHVPEGSKIRTASESAVEIMFEDGATCYQRSDTMMGIETARKKGDLKVHKIFLETGKAVTKIREATGEKSRFEIQTPSAICAARGTEFRTSVDSYRTTRSEVLEGMVGVEAMKKAVELKKGEGTVVEKGSPPHEPKKLLPPPSLSDRKPVYKSIPLRLIFNEGEGFVSYRAVLARESNCKDIVYEQVLKPGEPFEIPEVEDGNYYVQAAGIDELGLEGIASEPLEITVRVNPVPPYINIPVDGAEYRGKNITCQWLNVKDAERYQVQIAEDDLFERIRIDRDDMKNLELETNQLDFSTFFFRIRSIAEDGFEGEWSDSIRFTIVPPPPAPPVEEPEIDKNEVHVRWKDLGEDFRYHFQMAMSEQFEDIIVDRIVDTPKLTLERPENSGMYFVRTSSIDTTGYEGSFGKAQSFEVKRFPYSIVAMIGAFFLIVFLVP